MENEQNFEIQYLASQLDENTTLVTAQERIDKKTDEILASAMEKYDHGKDVYSVQFNENSSGDTLTVNLIDQLVTGVNTNLTSVLALNKYVKAYILKDDVIGETYSAINANINSNYRLTYTEEQGRNKLKVLQKAKDAVEQFNQAVKIKKFIHESVLQTMTEGNYICYLRLDGGNAVIDMYPLGIAEITDYTSNGDPICQINLKEFKNRLKKTYLKNRNGKALYFENLDREVEATFPSEVVEAYRKGENYARLDVRHTGVMRINNFNSRYGVSHFVRSLRPAVILDNIEDSDIVNNKAKAKKIIFQKLRKEILGPNTDYTRKGFEYAAHAHNELMSAWRNSTVLYTGIPAVESLEFVEPETEGAPTEKIALYRNAKMTALGVTYIDPNLGSVSAANISLSQLMKVIDSAADQLSDILHKFYVLLLEHCGIDVAYAPLIDVLDSSQMEMDVKRHLAEFMFSKLNLSYGSALEVLGLDADHEAARRSQENEDGFEEIFTPHASQYTSSGNSTSYDRDESTPRETSDPDKQAYDKARSESL